MKKRHGNENWKKKLWKRAKEGWERQVVRDINRIGKRRTAERREDQRCKRRTEYSVIKIIRLTIIFIQENKQINIIFLKMSDC